jgi:hypothetical protein
VARFGMPQLIEAFIDLQTCAGERISLNKLLQSTNVRPRRRAQGAREREDQDSLQLTFYQLTKSLSKPRCDSAR